jgi:hypothetical protein
MNSSNQSNSWRFKNAIWENAAICVLVVAIGVLSGCGGYQAPTGGTMPGQTPRRYPMQHRTTDLTGHAPVGSGVVLPR